MGKKIKYRFVLKSKNDSYNILSVLEKKENKELIIFPESARFYLEQELGEATDIQIKNQYFSIHNSDNSTENINVLKHTIKYDKISPRHTYIFTRAFKQNKLLCPLFLSRCHSLKNKSPNEDFKNDILISIGDYDPKISMLYYMIVIGNKGESFESFNVPDINFETINFKQYSLTMLWSYARFFSDITGAKSYFLTLPDEKAKSQLQEGFSKDEIIHFYRDTRQFQHTHFLNTFRKKYPDLEIPIASLICFGKNSDLSFTKLDERNIKKFFAYNCLSEGKYESSCGRQENSLQLFVQGREIFVELDEKFLIAEAYMLEGTVHHILGNSEKALFCYKNSLRLYCHLKLFYHISLIYINISKIFRDTFKSRVALIYCYISVSISTKYNYNSLLALVKREIGIIQKDRGKLAKAKRYLSEANDLYRIDQNKEGEGFCLANLGIVLCMEGILEESIKFHQKALDIFIKLNNQLGIANEIANIGSLYCSLKNYKKGIGFLEKALTLHKNFGYQYGIATDLKLLGFHLVEIGLISNAKQYLSECIVILRRINNHEGANEVENFLGSLK